MPDEEAGCFPEPLETRLGSMWKGAPWRSRSSRLRRLRVSRSLGGRFRTVLIDSGVVTLLRMDSGVLVGDESPCVSSGVMFSILRRRRMAFAPRQILEISWRADLGHK